MCGLHELHLLSPASYCFMPDGLFIIADVAEISRRDYAMICRSGGLVIKLTLIADGGMRLQRFRQGVFQ